MHEEMLTYGLKRGTEDDLRHVDSVPNGLDCDCVCPHCQHDLIARNGGTKKIHHFAHASGADCGGARMTALHILAQKILERDKIVMLPAYKTEYVSHDAVLKEFYNVVLEQVWKDDSSTRKPDCVCTQEDGKNPLWVEIFCRHKVDDTRQLDIRRRQVYCIEIDFSDLLQTEYSEKDVINRLTTDTTHKRWICCPVWDKEEEEKSLKAQAQWEEQQRREAEKRLKEDEDEEKKQRLELEKIKAMLDHNLYLQELAKIWRTNPNSAVVEDIVEEIKNHPYVNYKEKETNMLDYLVPDKHWLRCYKDFPRNRWGRKVFNYLIRFYYRTIDLNDKFCSRLDDLDNPMWKLLKKQEKSEEDVVLLEYMVDIWILGLLNKSKNIDLAKDFSNKYYIRTGLMEIMTRVCEIGQHLEDDIRNSIISEYMSREAGELIVKIFEICFPQKLPKNAYMLDSFNQMKDYLFNRENKKNSDN